jgi:WD40 repeat protein
MRIFRTAIAVVSVAAFFLLSFARAQQPVASKPPQLPAAYVTLEDSKKFNAVQLGPGNSFSIRETPPDFQLAEVAISNDGRLVAMAWRSGRIELWELSAKKRVSEFKSTVGWPSRLKFNAQGNQLLVAGSGKIVWLELPKGKKTREFEVPLGKYKYDPHDLVLDANGKWLAYANEENGKVLDTTAEPPKVVIELHDASSIALTQDGSELLTINRSELSGFRTDTWELIGHWPLKGTPMNTSSPLVRTGVTSDGTQTVVVPSQQGLVIYRTPEMSGEFVTEKPTSDVAFSRLAKAYVNLAGEITFLNSDGKTLCRKSYKGRTGYSVSDDGQWLALSQSSNVDLWRIEDLVRSCTAP